MSEDNKDDTVPEERFTADPEKPAMNASSEASEAPALAINGQYIKDFSFSCYFVLKIVNQRLQVFLIFVV